MMKLHMVIIIQSAIALNVIDERKKNNLGEKGQKKTMITISIINL